MLLSGFSCAAGPRELGAQVWATANHRDAAFRRAVAERQAVVAELSTKAKVVTENMAKLGATAKGDENEALMKAMLQELQEMNQRLSKLQGDVDELKGWRESQEKVIPALTKDVAAEKRFKPSLYTQFQYRDSNERGAQDAFSGQHSFQLRRVRFGGTYQIDPTTSVKASFEGTANHGKGIKQWARSKRRF